MFKEFRDFAMRGNVVDMAVGIVIGGAFGKIVSSFVNDVLMPPIGLAMGGVDFTSLFLNLSQGSYDTLAAAQEVLAPPPTTARAVLTGLPRLRPAQARFADAV